MEIKKLLKKLKKAQSAVGDDCGVVFIKDPEGYAMKIKDAKVYTWDYSVEIYLEYDSDNSY